MIKECPVCFEPYNKTRLLKSIADVRRIFYHGGRRICRGAIGQHFTLLVIRGLR